MPTATENGMTRALSTPALSLQAQVPWYSLLILGVLALGLGVVSGWLIPKQRAK